MVQFHFNPWIILMLGLDFSLIYDFFLKYNVPWTWSEKQTFLQHLALGIWKTMTNLEHWDLAFFVIPWRTINPTLLTYVHLLSTENFFLKYFILYWVAHGKQYCLLIGPPISCKLPMLSFHKASWYTQCLLLH